MAVTSFLQIGRDPRTSIPNWLLDPPASSDEGQNIQLVASTNYTLAVPANTTLALFYYSAGANVAVSRGAAPLTAPTSGAFGATAGVLNPPGFKGLSEGDTLNFFGDDAWWVYVRWFVS